MTSTQQHLQNLYTAFNTRDIEAVLSALEPDVQWANGMEGGFVHGRDRVRAYWQKQFEQVSPQLEILSIHSDDRERSIVIVHQIVRDLQGNSLSEQQVGHRFTFKDGLVTLFEIIDSEPKPNYSTAE